jgi:protein gp37
MSEHSKIEWTDATWNPLRGCTKISPGCKHCYAETFAERFRGVAGHPYEQGFDLLLVPEKLAEPFHWSSPRTVFVNSMSDLFQPGVPDGYIEDVVKVMVEADWHTYQVLTKRSERLRDLLPANVISGGASVLKTSAMAYRVLITFALLQLPSNFFPSNPCLRISGGSTFPA